MSINDELTRIETAKADIKSAIVECGVDDIEDLTSAQDKIEVYADYIRQIPQAVFSTLKIKLTGSVTSQETGFNASGLAEIATTTNHSHSNFTVFGVTYNGSVAKTVNMSTLIGVLGVGDSAITDDTHLLTSHINGFSTSGNTTTIYKRAATHLWTYIKGKADGTYLSCTDIGSTTTPIYITGGVATLCSTYAGGTKVTLNGTAKGANTASFYAPTVAGTSGQYLTSSGSGAPTWKTINPYDANLSRTANTVLAAPNGSAGVATFRKLVMADLPDLTEGSSASYRPIVIRGGDAAGSFKPYYVTGITVSASNKALCPNSTNTGSLGNSTYIWGTIYGKNLYATTTIYLGSTYKATINPPNTTAGTFYFPNTGGTLVTHASRGTAVGGTAQPVYIASTGRATAISVSIAAGNIIQLSQGTISHASSYSCGGNTQFIYATGGKLTATTVDKGSSSQGVYMKAGVMTAMTYSLNATVNAASTAGVLAYYSSTTAVGPFTVPAATGTIYVTGSSSSKLYYASGVYIESGKTVKAASFYETSDARLKDFYDDVEVDLEKLALIPKKYFKWKLDGNKLEIGTSAQEIQKIYPELVDANEDGILTVSYSKLSIVALKGIDKLYEEVKQLKDRVRKLESKI